MKKSKQEIENEIANLPNSYIDCLAPIISRYRQMHQGDGNVVKFFVQRVEEERQRYARKFAAMKANSDYRGFESQIEAAEKAVNTAAAVEVARAYSDGKVDVRRASNV